MESNFRHGLLQLGGCDGRCDGDLGLDPFDNSKGELVGPPADRLSFGNWGTRIGFGKSKNPSESGLRHVELFPNVPERNLCSPQFNGSSPG